VSAVEGATVADLLEQAAARQPGATAVVAGGRSLTYAELDARANGLAHRLQAAGVGPDVLVGVRIGRSLELAVALQAVLKAGGGCVPLDPAYPEERLVFMVEDSAVAAVLTEATVAGAGASDVAPARGTRADHVGYVIYTSGSTGEPKGVLLTHRGLVNHHLATAALYGLGPGDRVLQFCSLGFDASIEELFPTWVAGATVVFRPDDAPLLGRGWLDWLDDQGVTVLNLPTAYWHAWVRDLDALDRDVPPAVRLVVVGGEQPRGPALRAWWRRAGGRSRWVNAYGPTETTCMSTFYEATGDEGDADPPIGRPLPGTTVAVVDGELLIGGAGLARGYRNRPELTAARFVEGPGGERMYRTGDLVRELASGDLAFAGRVDDQVKVRGFRVEPGEVEAALARHPSVAAAAVVGGDDRLVAYVAGDAEPGELRRFLAGRLPTHLVPDAFVTLDALPITANGKVDRAALPEAPPAARATGTAALPPAEARMAAIWAAVLGLDPGRIGPADDFFDLGGHSLLATQVVARVREEFGTDTPLRAIFEAPTVAGLAALVNAESAASPGGPPLAPSPRAPGARVPLSLAQEQMYGLEAAADPPGLYNITALHTFADPVDVGALREALAAVTERHEILRTGFGDGDDGPYQFALPQARVPLTVTEDPSPERIAAQDAEPFDLGTPPLVRAGLYGRRLAVTLDHLVADGTGAAIFMHDLLAAYGAITAGRAPALAELPVQFADFALWQRAHVTGDVLQRQLRWWLDTLAGMPLGPAVPFDHLPDRPTRRISSTTFAVPDATRARLDEVARATGSTLFTVAAAAAGALLGRHGGSTDVVMSTTLSGRNRAELEDLVGMFSGIGRLRTDLSGDPAFAEVVVRSRDRVLGMFENQDVPFMRVRRALLPDFPTGGVALAAALPVEFQYFHTGDDQELFFRGQLHPLSLTVLDDGARLTGRWSYKLDFYEPSTVDRLAADLERLLAAVAADPSLRFADLPVSGPPR
jgi:amino acid adenylation domain-containing protein